MPGANLSADKAKSEVFEDWRLMVAVSMGILYQFPKETARVFSRIRDLTGRVFGTILKVKGISPVSNNVYLISSTSLYNKPIKVILWRTRFTGVRLVQG